MQSYNLIFIGLSTLIVAGMALECYECSNCIKRKDPTKNKCKSYQNGCLAVHHPETRFNQEKFDQGCVSFNPNEDCILKGALCYTCTTDLCNTREDRRFRGDFSATFTLARTIATSTSAHSTTEGTGLKCYECKDCKTWDIPTKETCKFYHNGCLAVQYPGSRFNQEKFDQGCVSFDPNEDCIREGALCYRCTTDLCNTREDRKFKRTFSAASTLAHTIATSTLTRTIATSTLARTIATSTLARTIATSTLARTIATSTLARTIATSTLAPTSATSTLAPTSATSTLAPTSATSTLAPTSATSTLAPTSAASTLAPTNATSTSAKPTLAPPSATSTLAPTSATSTLAPTSATSTLAPTSATSTLAPTSATSTLAPTSATSTLAPTSATSTLAPTSATSTSALSATSATTKAKTHSTRKDFGIQTTTSGAEMIKVNVILATFLGGIAARIFM